MSTLINSSLNASVIAEAVTTGSANKAYQQLGFFEKIVDYFRGNPKWQDIQSLVEKINTPTQQTVGQNPDIARLARFVQLTDLVKDEYKDKFFIQITNNKENNTWGYNFKIDNAIVSTARDLPMDNPALAHFQSAVITNNLSHVLIQQGKESLLSELETLKTQFAELDQYSSAPPDISIANKFTLLAKQLPDLNWHVDIDHNDFFYKLSFDNTRIYSASMADNVEDKMNSFQALWVAKVKVEVPALLNMLKDGLTLDNFIEGNIQCMVDEPADQESLKQLLKDPSYSKAKFTEVRDHEDSAKMVAVFTDKELVFSARAATNNELRGSILKERLESTHYENLYDIVSDGHMTEKDGMLLYMLNGLRNTLQFQFSEAVEDHAMTEATYQQISHIAVGNTTLGKLWGLNTSASSPAVEDLTFVNASHLA